MYRPFLIAKNEGYSFCPHNFKNSLPEHYINFFLDIMRFWFALVWRLDKRALQLSLACLAFLGENARKILSNMI